MVTKRNRLASGAGCALRVSVELANLGRCQVDPGQGRCASGRKAT